MPLKLSKKSINMVHQREQSECSLACLAMILSAYGYESDINALRNRFKISSQGASLNALLVIAEKLKLNARALRLEISELKDLQTPAILHWNFNHYVVLTKASRNKFSILDPAAGRKVLSRKQVSRQFSGVAIELSPGAGFEPEDNTEKLTLSDLWRNARGLGFTLFQVFLLSLLLQVFVVAMPFYTQIFIDDVLVNNDVELLKILATGFLFLVLIKCLTELLRSLAVLYLGNALAYQIASSVCHHLYHLKADYFSKRHIGDIVSRFSSVNKLKDFLCSGIVEIIIDGMMVLSTVILMFIYSSLLTFIALCSIAIYGVLRLSSYRFFYKRNQQLLQDAALENTHFIENIRAIQSIKIFGKQNARLRTWQNRYTDLVNSGVRLEKLNIAVSFANNLLHGAENILLVLVGGFSVMNNELSIGMLIAFLSFKDQFYQRSFALLDAVFEFRLLDVHLDRLADILLYKNEYEDGKDGMNTTKLPAERPDKKLLQLEQVCFRYDDVSPYLFRDVNLSIEEGESVAIIGASGCGKSTLLKIIAGFLAADSGKVLLMGNELKHLGELNYRTSLAAVMQDDCLLSGSILENISFFDLEPDIRRVQECAAIASIAGNIEALPMQYDTPIGNMGESLSGGQLQRLMLARALYKQPKLLLLDEASSHLDLNTESAINHALNKLPVTKIIVAHRPHSILYADKVCRLTVNGLEFLSNKEVKASLQQNDLGDRGIAA